MTRAKAAAIWALMSQLLEADLEIDRATPPQMMTRKDGDGALFGIVVRVKRRGRVDTEHLRRR